MDQILSDIRDGKYDEPEYPSKPEPPELLGYKAMNLTLDDIKELPAAKEAHDKALDAYTKAKIAYGVEVVKRREQFKHDLEKHFGTTGKPKADLLWQKTWELGHAYGFEEVFSHYADLHELIL